MGWGFFPLGWTCSFPQTPDQVRGGMIPSNLFDLIAVTSEAWQIPLCAFVNVWHTGNLLQLDGAW